MALRSGRALLQALALCAPRASALPRGLDDSLGLIQHAAGVQPEHPVAFMMPDVFGMNFMNTSLVEVVTPLARGLSRFMEANAQTLAKLISGEQFPGHVAPPAAAMLYSGKGDDATPVMCDDKDLEGMSRAMLENDFRRPKAERPKPPQVCDPKRLFTPVTTLYRHDMWNLVGQCIQASQHVSATCSTCFVNFAQELLGKPLQPSTGCMHKCTSVPAFCSLDKDNKGCMVEVSKCMWCAKKPLKTLVKCTGIPYQKYFLNIFDDVVVHAGDGSLAMPGVFDNIIWHSVPLLAEDPK